MPSQKTVSSMEERADSMLRRLPGLYLELGKARLTALVVTTTLVGFLVSSGPVIDGWRLLWTLIGTALAAGGANALNEWMEAHPDGLMRRTRGRPVPSGRLTRRHAFVVSFTAAAAGPVLLAILVNALTAGLALLTTVLYIGFYTPLKSRSTLCTLVGAVCGAIPPMMGCTGALGHLDHRAWILAAVLFVWQIPHFLALAWLYRDDYAAGGFRMLPSVDPTGRTTARAAVLYSMALLPVGVAATLSGMAGWIYAAGSLLLGLAFLVHAGRLLRERTARNARRLFLASVIYLPLLLGLMVLDRGRAGELTAAAAMTDSAAPAATPVFGSGRAVLP